MKREARVLIGLCAVLAACVPDLEGAPCVVDEHCPSGQRCGGDGFCSSTAMGGGDGSTGGGGIISGLDAGTGGGTATGGGTGTTGGGTAGGDATDGGTGIRAERAEYNFGDVMVNGSAMATVSFINDSEDSTGAMSVGVGGGDAAGFSIVNDGCGGALGAHGRCSVELRFFPNRSGTFDASLDVVASPGGTVSMRLVGNGLGPAQLQLSPSMHDFGPAVQGMAATPQTFRVRNAGGVRSGMVTIAATGTSASEVIIVNNACIVPLIPAGECEFTAIFIPGSPGAKTATLTASGTPGGMALASITGEGLSTPSLKSSPDFIAFAPTVVHAMSAEVTVTITNEGSGPTPTLPASVVGGTHSSDFTITDDGCDGAPLAGNSSCLVKLRFTPTFTGPRSATLTVGTTTIDVDVPLSGTALTAAALSLAPTSHDLGDVTTGTNVTTPFILTNTGESSATAVTPSVSGTGFAVASNGCPATLAGGAQCTIEVRFGGANPGDGNMGTLSVNATGVSAVMATLTADLVAPGALEMTPPSFTFPRTLQGATADTVFTVKNTGGTQLPTPTFGLSGAMSSQYVVVSTTCSAALNPNATCTATVRFQPSTSARGIQNAILQATAGSYTDSSSVSGEALKPATLSVSPSALAFGAITTGQTSPSQDVTVTNTGDVTTGTIAATTGSIAFPVASVANDCRGQTLPQGQSCVLRLNFVPTGSGAQTDTLNLSSTPGGSPMVALSGTGRSPAALTLVAASGSSTAFGGVVIPGTKEQSFTLTNTGETASSNLSVLLTGNGFSVAMGGMGACVAGAPLAAGASCTVRVVFTASPPGGAATGSLAVSATAGGMATLNLTATSQKPALLSGDEYTHSFGLVAVGASAPSYLWTVTNSGDVASGVIDAITVAAPFTKSSDDCSGETLAAGATCTVRFGFSPTATGAASAAIAATANPGSGAALALSGTGGWTLSMTASSAPTSSVSTTDGKISCAAGQTCTAVYNDGDTPTLRAHSSNGGTGLHFTAWTDPVECTNYGRGSWCTVNMNGHKTAAAQYGSTGANLAFVTSTFVRANVGLSGFDALCNATATDAGINNGPGNAYVAFVGDTNNTVSERWTSNGGLERLDGKPFARSRSELLAHEIRHPLHLDEFGRRVAGGDDSVWTGATVEGKPGRNCDDWSRIDTDGGVSDFVDRGVANGGPYAWLNRESNYTCASATARVMCFQNKNNAVALSGGAVPATGKRMFITSAVPMPASETAADAVCATQATAAQLTGVYRALIASTSQNAASVLTDAQAYYRVDGSLIGTGAQMKTTPPSLVSGIWHNAAGALVDSAMNESHMVWTGATNVNTLGTAASTCDGWTNVTADSTAGLGLITNSGFFNSFGAQPCSGQRSLYCVEQ